MEDFRIFTVNDTTDSNLEEYNSEIELEKEESNLINNGVVISQETSHFSPENRYELNENGSPDPQKLTFKNVNLMEELNEVSTIVSNKNNTNFFKSEIEESNSDQRQSSNNSAKNTFSFKKPGKKLAEANKRKKNKEKNGPGKKQAKIKKLNNVRKTSENSEKNGRKNGMKTRSKLLKKGK